jgi:hypothetical protein
MPFSHTTNALPDCSTDRSFPIGSRLALTRVGHGAATRLVAPLAPAQVGPTRAEDVPAAPDTLDVAQLSALYEAAHDLNVGTIAVIHTHQDHAIVLLD